MPNIDEKVVQMTFDNKQFEKGVAQSLKSIEDLKKALELDKMSNSLKSLEQATDSISKHMGTLQESVSRVASIFTPLGNLGLNALNKISNAALNAAESFLKMASGMDAINDGKAKYESYTKSVQTITNATGKSVSEVAVIMDKLMHYTDETSYDFAEMASSIGKFTSVGIDLERAEAAMEGIANWAAKSGAGKMEANRAMYNISQAMGAGAMKLIDWKSIENANMATKEFKETAIETAKELGVLSKNADINYKNFNETLKSGWLTADVMTAVLEKYADTSTDFGLVAYHAAQEALTFSDAIGALKDAVSSGWMKSFEYLFGDLDEARVLWTGVANALYDFSDIFTSARNELLKGWHELGGYNAAVEAASNIWDTFMNIVLGVKEAFEDIFPPITVDNLVAITEKVRDTTAEWKNMFGLDTETELTEEVDTLINKAVYLNRVVEEGAQSEYVKRLQERLANAGYLSDKSFADGIYGPATVEAVKNLQRALGVEVTGAWDAATMKAAVIQRVFMETEKREKKQILKNVEEVTEMQEQEIDYAKELDRELKKGDKNESVMKLQEQLVKLGYLTDAAGADGIYGKNTQTAVANLQRALGVDVTGVWDEATRAAVMSQKVFTEVVETEVTSYKQTTGLTTQMITLQDIVKGFFSAVKIGTSIITSLLKIAGSVVKMFSPFLSVGVKVVHIIGGMFENLSNNLHNADTFGKIVEKVTTFLTPFANAIKLAADWLNQLLDGYVRFINNDKKGNTFQNFFSFLSERFSGNDFVQSIIGIFNQVKTVASEVFGYIKNAIDFIFNGDDENTDEKKNGLTVFLEGLLKVVTVLANGIAIGIGIIGYALKALYDIASKYLKPVIKGLKTLFGDIVGKFKSGEIKSIPDFFKSIMDTIGNTKVGIFFSKAIETIKSFFETSKEYLAEKFPGIFEFFKEKWQALKDFFHFDSNTDFLTTLKEKFEQLKEMVVNAISIIKQKLSEFKEYLSYLFSRDENGKLNLFSELQKAINNFKPTLEKFIEFKDKFVEAWKQLIGVGKEKGSKLLKGKGFTSVFDKIKGFFEKIGNIKFNKLIGPALIGVAAYSLFTSAKAIKNISKGLLGLFDNLTGGKILAKKDTIGDTALKIAGAIAAVALSIGLLSIIDAEKANNGLKAFKKVLIYMAGAMAALMALEKWTGASNNLGSQALMLTGSIAALAVGLWLMTKVVKDATKDPENLRNTLILMVGMIVLLGGIEAAIAALSKGHGAINISGMLQMCIGVGVLAVAFGHLIDIVKDADDRDLTWASGIIGGMIALIGGIAIWLSSTPGTGGLKISTMIAFVGELVALIIAFKDVIHTIENTDTEVILGAVAIVGGMVVAIIKIAESLSGCNTTVATVLSQLATGFVIYELGETVSKIADSLSEAILKVQDVDPWVIVAFLGGVAVVAGVMGGLAVAFSKIPLDALVQGGIALEVLTLIISGAIAIISGVTNEAIRQFGTTLWIIGSKLGSFNDMVKDIDWDNLQKVTDYFGGSFKTLITTIIGIGFDAANEQGEKLFTFGNHIKSYGESVKDITDDMIVGGTNAEELVKSASRVAGTMNSITAVEGVKETLGALGAALKLYYDELSDITVNENGKLPTVDSKMISEAFTALKEAIPKEDINYIQNFAKGGDNDMVAVAIGIEALGTAMKSYGKDIGNINPKKVETANNVLTTLKGLYQHFSDHAIMDAIIGMFGETTVEKIHGFSDNLVAIGTGLSSYINSIENINDGKIKTANGVLGFMASLNTLMPVEGGIFGLLFGKRESLDAFASNISTLGDGIQQFANKTAEADFSKVPNALPAIQTIADVLSELDKVGGLEGWLAGNKDLSVLGNGLPSVGENLMGFATAIDGFSYDKVQGALDAFKQITDWLIPIGATEFTDAGGIPHNILEDTGKGLRGFFKEIGGIFVDNEVVKEWKMFQPDETMPVIEAVTQLGKYLVDGIVSGIKGSDAGEDGSERIRSALNKAVIDAVVAVKGIENAYADTGSFIVDKMVDGLNSNTEFRSTVLKIVVDTVTDVRNMQSVYTQTGFKIIGDVASGLNSNNEIRSTLLRIVVDAITDVSNMYSTYQSVGEHLVDGLKMGMYYNSDQVTSMAERIAEAACNCISYFYDDFERVGEYLDEGLKMGLYNNASVVTAMARRVAMAAYNQACQALGVNSPSKKGIWIGEMFDEGFAKGLSNAIGLVEGNAKDLGSAAIQNATMGVQSLANVISADMDDTPVIRPILDLSQIRSGAAEMGSLLNGQTGYVNMNASVSAVQAQNISSSRSQYDSNYIADMMNKRDAYVERLLEDFSNKFDRLDANMRSLKVYINGNTLVGEIMPSVNRSMGKIVARDYRSR